jgi:telomerase protein component 1
MRVERDILVRFVFPELRERCEKRRLHIVDIDLRWGVSEEQAERKVLQVCLDEIDRCRPFFIGILGERYGWVPARYEIPDEPSYLWLRALEPGRSITALEIYYGVLREPERARRAFFYFRSHEYIDELPEDQRPDHRSENERASQNLIILKKEVESHAHTETYQRPDDGFSKMVLEDLWSAIQAEHPEETAETDELAEERAFHDSFLERVTRYFIGRSDLLDDLETYVTSAEPVPLVVTGSSGTGKSALMGEFARIYSAKDPGSFLLPHFIGVSPGSVNIRHTLRRLCRELARLLGVDDEILQDYVNLRVTFAHLLERASDSGYRTILILDGLDQLQESHGARSLDWLPHRLPRNVRLIVTTVEDDCLEVLRGRTPKVVEHQVDVLDPVSCRNLLTTTLAEYGKRLDPNQMDHLMSKREAGNPLYLTIAAEELRVFGAFEKVTDRIADLPQDILSLFGQVLLRLESDNDPERVREALSLLASSRYGLLETEMLELLRRAGEPQLPPALWAPIYRSMRFFLRPPDDRGGATLGFLHRQIREAVITRYLHSGGDMRAAHRKLATYFRAKADPRDAGNWSANSSRGLAELPFHLLSAGMWTGLASVLCDLRFVAAKCAAGMTYDLTNDYDMAVAQIPQGQERKQRDADRSTRLLRFRREVTAYAVDSRASRGELSILPEVPESLVPGDGVEHEGQRDRSLLQPLLEFRAFISASGQALARYCNQPGFCVQHAFNNAQGSVVGQAAEAIVNDPSFGDPCLLRLQGSRSSMVRRTALRTTVEAHRLVTVLQQSLDGATIYSGGDDGTLRVWSAGTGECLRSISLTSPFYQVHGLAVSADGTVGITVPDASDKVLLIWDLNAGTQIGCLEGHEKGISSIAITPDGAIALSAGSDSTLRVWDVTSAVCVRVHHLDQAPKVVALSPDARVAIVVCQSTAKLMELSSGQTLSEIAIPASHSRCAAASLDLRWMLIGEDKKLRIWDTRTGDSRTFDWQGAASIRAIALSLDGNVGLSAGDDAIVRVWDIAQERCVRVFHGHSDAVNSLCIAPDASYAVSGGRDGSMRVWDLEARSDVEPDLEQRTLDPIRAVLMPLGNVATSQTKGGKTQFWNTETGDELTVFKGVQMFITDDGRLEGSRVTGGIEVRESLTGRKWNLRLDDPPKNAQEEHPLLSLPTLRIAANGHRAVSHMNTSVWVWDLDSGIPSATIPMPEGVASVAIAGRGHRVAAGGGQPRGKDDWKIRLLDPGIGVLNELEGHGNIVSALEITPDDCVLVSGSHDGTVRLWDLESGAMLRSFGQPYSPVSSEAPFYMGTITQVLLTSDGRRAVILNSYGKTWLCDLQSGGLVGPLETHGLNTARRHLAVISTDGKWLFTGVGLRNIYVWDMERVELVIATVEQAEQQCLAVHGNLLAFGDQSGRVTFSTTTNLLLRSPIVTARRDGPVPCPHCHGELTIPWSAAAAIEGIESSTRSQIGLSPCLDLPESAWNTAELSANCPCCRNEIRFNPFFAGGARTSLPK